MLEKLSDILEQVPDINRRMELAERLHKNGIGGWRGLFDPYCTEWHNCTVPEKLDFLLLLMKESRCNLMSMFELYQKTYIEKGMDHIARDGVHGLLELLEVAVIERSKEKRPLG